MIVSEIVSCHRIMAKTSASKAKKARRQSKVKQHLEGRLVRLIAATPTAHDEVLCALGYVVHQHNQTQFGDQASPSLAFTGVVKIGPGSTFTNRSRVSSAVPGRPDSLAGRLRDAHR